MAAWYVSMGSNAIDPVGALSVVAFGAVTAGSRFGGSVPGPCWVVVVWVVVVLPLVATVLVVVVLALLATEVFSDAPLLAALFVVWLLFWSVVELLAAAVLVNEFPRVLPVVAVAPELVFSPVLSA